MLVIFNDKFALINIRKNMARRYSGFNVIDYFCDSYH